MNDAKLYEGIVSQLNRQKEDLGMTYAVIATRSGVSEPTVKRILSGQHPSAHFAYVLAIAECLGVDLLAKPKSAHKIRLKQAKEKALKILKLVRGNAALEGNKLSKSATARMLQNTTLKLLSGPSKHLWSN